MTVHMSHDAPGEADPYHTLVAAIVERACSDYRSAIANENLTRAREVEQFFRSEWFQLLVGGRVDGEAAIRALRGRKRRSRCW